MRVRGRLKEFRAQTIRYCLERAGIGWRDVAHVAIASRPWRAWQRQASFRARLAPLAPVSSGYFVNKASGELGRELNNVRIVRQLAGAPEGRVESLDHHLCHAASAFYASAFERALVVSLDEKGDGRAGFVGIGEGARLARSCFDGAATFAGVGVFAGDEALGISSARG